MQDPIESQLVALNKRIDEQQLVIDLLFKQKEELRLSMLGLVQMVRDIVADKYPDDEPELIIDGESVET